jgi:hypothetical protein
MDFHGAALIIRDKIGIYITTADHTHIEQWFLRNVYSRHVFKPGIASSITLIFMFSPAVDQFHRDLTALKYWYYNRQAWLRAMCPPSFQEAKPEIMNFYMETAHSLCLNFQGCIGTMIKTFKRNVKQFRTERKQARKDRRVNAGVNKAERKDAYEQARKNNDDRKGAYKQTPDSNAGTTQAVVKNDLEWAQESLGSTQAVVKNDLEWAQENLGSTQAVVNNDLEWAQEDL